MNINSWSELPSHHSMALYLAARPGATYKDVAAQLRQEPETVLRWITAGLRELRDNSRGRAQDLSSPAALDLALETSATSS